MLLCPNCLSEDALLLERISRMSPLNHFTCAVCGHAWTERKEFDSTREDDHDDDSDDPVH
jgi:hypothetical protein